MRNFVLHFQIAGINLNICMHFKQKNNLEMFAILTKFVKILSFNAYKKYSGSGFLIFYSSILVFIMALIFH